MVDYDPAWPAEFERLKARLVSVLGDVIVDVQHVGSTAVPGLAAKPVVDLYAVVLDIERATDRLGQLGYVEEGELGVPGRLGFAWPKGEKRHHLYLCAPNDAGLAAVVRFRDYMRADSDKALEYAELKRELAVRHREDRDAYADGKSAFIERVLSEARG